MLGSAQNESDDDMEYFYDTQVQNTAVFMSCAVRMTRDEVFHTRNPSTVGAGGWGNLPQFTPLPLVVQLCCKTPVRLSGNPRMGPNSV